MISQGFTLFTYITDTPIICSQYSQVIYVRCSHCSQKPDIYTSHQSAFIFAHLSEVCSVYLSHRSCNTCSYITPINRCLHCCLWMNRCSHGNVHCFTWMNSCLHANVHCFKWMNTFSHGNVHGLTHGWTDGHMEMFIANMDEYMCTWKCSLLIWMNRCAHGNVHC